MGRPAGGARVVVVACVPSAEVTPPADRRRGGGLERGHTARPDPATHAGNGWSSVCCRGGIGKGRVGDGDSGVRAPGWHRDAGRALRHRVCLCDERGWMVEVARAVGGERSGPALAGAGARVRCPRLPTPIPPRAVPAAAPLESMVWSPLVDHPSPRARSYSRYDILGAVAANQSMWCQRQRLLGRARCARGCVSVRAYSRRGRCEAMARMVCAWDVYIHYI